MFDTRYHLKAYTDVHSDDHIWNELIFTGTFSIQTQEFFAKELFTEDVANANKIAILKSDKLKYDRISGYIFNRDNIKVANVVIVGDGKPFDPDDMEAFEEFTNKITREIHDDEYFTSYGKEYHEDIIIKLLDNFITNPIIYTPHVQILLDGFDDYLYVAVVQEVQDDYRKIKLIDLKNLLENKYRSFKYAVYFDHIVMIMSAKHKDFFEEHFFDTDDNPFKRNNILVGISDSFENPYELRAYYDQAVVALKNGIEKNRDQFVFLYSKYVGVPS